MSRLTSSCRSWCGKLSHVGNRRLLLACPQTLSRLDGAVSHSVRWRCIARPSARRCRFPEIPHQARELPQRRQAERVRSLSGRDGI